MNNLLTAIEMLNFIVKNSGECFAIEKIINSGWVSTYFIFHQKTFKNGKVHFTVDYAGEAGVWTNDDFLEFLPDEKWRVG